MQPSKDKFRSELKVKDGHWWGIVEKSGTVTVWAPVAKYVPGNFSNVFGCLRLAVFYQSAGILGTITGPIVYEDGSKVVKVVQGTNKLSEEAIKWMKANKVKVVL